MGVAHGRERTLMTVLNGQREEKEEEVVVEWMRVVIVILASGFVVVLYCFNGTFC